MVVKLHLQKFVKSLELKQQLSNSQIYLFWLDSTLL